MKRRRRKRNTGSASQAVEKQEKVTLNQDWNNLLAAFKEAYSYPKNADFVIREFHIETWHKKAVILYINSITKSEEINHFIVKPLLQNSKKNSSIEEIVTVSSMKKKKSFEETIKEINNGNAALLVEGEDQAYTFNVPNFKSRGIEKPDNESVVKGPKEAFSEKVYTNISLIRKRLRNEGLTVEQKTISDSSHNDVYILYLKNIANEQLIDNVKERLEKLDTDAIQNLSLLEQYIEDRKYSIFPSILYTERPDRAVSFLEDGYIVLLMENSPDSLVLPATFWSMYHSSEDHYLRYLYGNFTRLLRIFAIFITLFTSAIYVAIISYHLEMIPPDLLLAIAASREKVTFPAIIEILLMELAFELIREAGLRVPSPIGPTIGIVGALILGQAAVEANIVSPIVVIVVALGGLSSFAIGDVSMNFAVRMLRFIFIFAAGLFGIYGMTAVFVIGLFYMVSLKSFGVPYLAPLTPTYRSSKDTVFRRILEKETYRPGYLKPKEIKKR